MYGSNHKHLFPFIKEHQSDDGQAEEEEEASLEGNEDDGVD